MNSLKRLASAVLLTALRDAQKGSQEAREWIMKDESSFPFWCRIYGISPALARQELRQAIKTVPVTRKLRKELITQALRESPELTNRAIGRRLKVNYETVRQIRKRMLQAQQRPVVKAPVLEGEGEITEDVSSHQNDEMLLRKAGPRSDLHQLPGAR